MTSLKVLFNLIVDDMLYKFFVDVPTENCLKPGFNGPKLFEHFPQKTPKISITIRGKDWNFFMSMRF